MVIKSMLALFVLLQYLVCMSKASTFLVVVLMANICTYAQQTEPYKPDAEFDFKLDYSFKERMLPEKSDYEAPGSDRRPNSTGPLPYLKTELRLLKLGADEVRVKVINHKGTTVVNRKASTDTIIKIDWGFSDDVKDQIASHSYTVLILNNDKKVLSRITLYADPDGTFLVNGQKRGRL
jgi:hypothetical protein